MSQNETSEGAVHAGREDRSLIVEEWLGRAARGKWMVRWGVRFGGQARTDGANRDPMRLGERERSWTPGQLVVWLLEGLGIAALFGVAGMLMPFGIIWWFAAKIDHEGLFARGFLWFGYLALFTMVALMIGTLRTKGWVEGRRIRVMAALAATVLLPWFMYATAAPGMMNFEVLAEQDMSPLWRWMTFYGYLYLDVIALGAPEAFFGQMAALQPASWQAALNTFIIRGVMTVGVIWCVWQFVAVRIRGQDEFIGTAEELRGYLRSEVKSTPGMRVYARSIERTIEEGPQGYPGDLTLACLSDSSDVLVAEPEKWEPFVRIRPLAILIAVNGIALVWSLMFWWGAHVRETVPGARSLSMGILKWTGIIAGGLIGLFLLLVIVGGVVQAFREPRDRG